METHELLQRAAADLTAVFDKTPWSLKRSTQSYCQPAEVRQALENFKPVEGWLCFQSAVSYFLPNQSMPDKGIVLYGELKGSGNTALHIRQNGSDGWLLTYFQEEQGNTYVVETFRFLGEFDEPGDLRYRVYWQRDGAEGYRPVCAAFNGFVSKGRKS